MKFITISQYFYKLYNAALLIMLLPIFSFIVLYFLATTTITESAHPTSWLTIANLSVVIAIDWLIMFLIFAKKIKSIQKDQGLRLKLEKYFRLTIVRYMLVMIVCLLLAYAFYITKEDWITGLFTVNLVLLGILWPTASKVCSDLKLRGDEREMVYYKKDHF